MENRAKDSHVKLTIKEWGVLLLILCGLFFIFIGNLLDRQQTWADMNYKDVYVFPSMSLRIDNGDEYGIHTSGPYYRLPAGQYRVRLTVDTDGSGTVRLTDSNNAQIRPDSFTFPAGERFPEMEFTIEEAARGFQIQVSFDSGTYLDINDIRLYSPFYQDHAITFSVIVLILYIVFLLRRHNVIENEGIKTFIILATGVIVCSAPVLKDNLAELIDLEFHMARIENLADGLASGQFPVRAGGFTFNGYGAITSVFYPDLLLVPFALLRLLGASPTYVIDLLCIACNGLSAVTAYFAGKRIFKDRNAGICVAILYVCCPYRLNNLFIRGALGEGLAMSFYPLFIEGLWEVVVGNQARWHLLVWGAFLIFMSHMITTVMAAMMAAGICAFALVRLIRERRWISLVKAMVVTLGLSLFFIIPMADSFNQGINADVINIYRLQDKTIAPAQLFIQSRGLLQGIADPTIDTAAVELGLPLIIGVMLVMINMIQKSPDAEMRKEVKLPLVSMTLMGLLFTSMTTTWFPWSHVSVITTFFNRIQFAWRFMGPASVLLCMVSGLAYAQYAKGASRYLPIILLSGAILVVLPTLSEQVRRGSFFQFGEGSSGDIRYDEYQIPGTDLSETYDREIHESTPGIIQNYKKKGTRITAMAEGEGTVEFPLFAFDGYVASLNGEPLPVDRGDNNRIRIQLPQGANGPLEIHYSVKRLWRVGDFISLVFFVFMIVKCSRKHLICSD